MLTYKEAINNLVNTRAVGDKITLHIPQLTILNDNSKGYIVFDPIVATITKRSYVYNWQDFGDSAIVTICSSDIGEIIIWEFVTPSPMTYNEDTEEYEFQETFNDGDIIIEHNNVRLMDEVFMVNNKSVMTYHDVIITDHKDQYAS